MSYYLDSKIWGPSTWYVMHQIAFHLPQNNSELPTITKNYLLSFYTNLNKLLPCPSCQKHYTFTLSKNPPSSHFKSGISTSNWTVNAHNLTNKGLKKKIIEFKLALDMYTKPNSIYYNINHIFISNFILHIIINSKDLINQRKEVANSLCYLHPCLNCREIFIEYLTQNSLNDVKTDNDMIIWGKNLNKLSKCN
jgi:hypothetical protein